MRRLGNLASVVVAGLLCLTGCVTPSSEAGNDAVPPSSPVSPPPGPYSWLPDASDFGAEVVPCEETKLGETTTSLLVDGGVFGVESIVDRIECWRSPTMGDETADADRLSSVLSDEPGRRVAREATCSAPLGSPENSNDVGLVMSFCSGAVVLGAADGADFVFYSMGATLYPDEWLYDATPGTDFEAVDWTSYPKEWVIIVATDPSGRARLAPQSFAAGEWRSGDGAVSVTLNDDGSGVIANLPQVVDREGYGCTPADSLSGPVEWEFDAGGSWLIARSVDGVEVELGPGGAWYDDWSELRFYMCLFDREPLVLSRVP